MDIKYFLFLLNSYRSKEQQHLGNNGGTRNDLFYESVYGEVFDFNDHMCFSHIEWLYHFYITPSEMCYSQSLISLLADYLHGYRQITAL